MSSRFGFIAGPCVIEDADTTLQVAEELAGIAEHYDVDFVFKASYDKANRTALDGFRGPGLEEGLRVLERVRQEVGVLVISDVHSVDEVGPAAEVLDLLQVPAFLCRQTDLVVAAAETGKPVNLKKAQFMAPEDMRYVVEKAASTGNQQLFVCERGVAFGYHNLVVDFRAFTQLRELGYPVLFDATHAVQVPSRGGRSAGRREYVRPLARAAAAYGVDGLFIETHPDPDSALSDGPNMLPLDEVEEVLDEALRVREALGDLF
jgi:2-dehydro-3-deoxyphosphooctonate aldolase (KDO 8-P synthase)